MKLLGYVLSGVCISACLATILRQVHLEKRKRQRRCTFVVIEEQTHVCGEETTRHYQMVEATQSAHEGAHSRQSLFEKVKEALGRRYKWYVFDKCTDGHVVLVKPTKPGADKFFWLFPNLFWRHLTNHSQFTMNETLFVRADLIPEAVSSLSVRIRKHAVLRSGSEKVRLDKPLSSRAFPSQRIVRHGEPVESSTSSGTIQPGSHLKSPHRKFPKGT